MDDNSVNLPKRLEEKMAKYQELEKVYAKLNAELFHEEEKEPYSIETILSCALDDYISETQRYIDSMRELLAKREERANDK